MLHTSVSETVFRTKTEQRLSDGISVQRWQLVVLRSQEPLLIHRALVFQIRLCQAFHQLSGGIDEGTASASHTTRQEHTPDTRCNWSAWVSTPHQKGHQRYQAATLPDISSVVFWLWAAVAKVETCRNQTAVCITRWCPSSGDGLTLKSSYCIPYSRCIHLDIAVTEYVFTHLFHTQKH